MHKRGMKQNNARDFRLFLRRVYLVKSMCPVFSVSRATNPESWRIVSLLAKRLELGSVVWTKGQTNKQTNKQILPAAAFSCGNLEPKLARTGFASR
jgi:hypothetical protein